MFWKPENSNMENGFKKKIQKCPLQKFMYSGNWKLEKTPEQHSQRGGLKKKSSFIQFFISKSPACLKKK